MTTIRRIKIRDERKSSWKQRFLSLILGIIQERRRKRQERWLQRRLSGRDPNYELVGRVIDHIHARDWPHNDKQKYVEYFMSLPKQERVIWATWIVQMEVQNGGFGQYFWNIPGACYISEAQVGFRDLNARVLANLFDEAVAMYTANRDAIKQTKTWDEYVHVMGVVPMDKALGRIHSRFLDKMQNFYALRARYIQENKDVFGYADEDPKKSRN